MSASITFNVDKLIKELDIIQKSHLPKAAAQLHAGSTQRLYVVDSGQQPIGVITRGDVVRALALHDV